MRLEDWAEWDRQASVQNADGYSSRTPNHLPPWWADSPVEGSNVGLVETVAYGWPIRVLRVRGRLIVPPDDYTTIIRKETAGLGAFENPWVARPAWGVAWVPIWSALLISGTVYGTSVWVLLWAASLARRWSRVRSERCVHCGYDLKSTGTNRGSTPRCPECGRDASTT